MINHKLRMILFVLFGSLCIKSTVGRHIAPQSYGNSAYRTSGQDVELGLGAEIGSGLEAGLETGLDAGSGLRYAGDDISISSFSNILLTQLMANSVFLNVFANPITLDLAIRIGISIAKGISAEFGLIDSYSTRTCLNNALMTIHPDAGPEVFGRAFVNGIGQIMINNRILNSFNALAIVNTVVRVIVNSASTCLYGNVGQGVGSKIGLEAGIGLRTDLGAAIDLGGRLDVSNIGASTNGLYSDNLNVGIFTDNGANIDSAASLKLDASLGGGLGIYGDLGIGSRSVIGSNLDNLEVNTDLGIDSTADLGVGAGLKVGADLDIGGGFRVDDSLDVGATLGVGNVLNSRSGLGIGTYSGADTSLWFAGDLGNKIGLSVTSGAEISAGLNTGIGTDLNIGDDIGAALNFGTGSEVGLQGDIDTDGSLSGDAILLFKAVLTKELLTDKYFRNMFSYSVPISALNAVLGAIAQYVSKAFGLPRSCLLPFEKIVLTVYKNKTLTLEEYAYIIATALIDVLKRANIISNAAVALQVTMAAKAISSGIANFLQISSVPGVGVSSSSKSYNSFLSVLNGLETLPYVGIDAVSLKFNPILKTAAANSFAVRFVKVLFYNLITSRRFYESFSLGMHSSSYKILSNYLGKSLAEAFGSPSSTFIYDIYVKALLTTINKLNYKTYARTLSVATAKALYSLGYFLSGNVNIQAEIAKNAIIRALVSRTRVKPVCTAIALFPGICNIPLTTQFTGVAPPDTLPKLKVGADSIFGLGLGLDLGARLRSNGGVGVAVGGNSGEAVKANAGAAADARVGGQLGVDMGGIAGIQAGVYAIGGGAIGANANVNSDFENKIKNDLDLEILIAELDADLELGLAAEESFKMSEKEKLFRRGRSVMSDFKLKTFRDSELDAAVKASLAADVNAAAHVGVTDGADVEVKAGLDARARLNAGAGLNAGLNLGTGLGLNTHGAVLNEQLLINNVLPLILANKLCISTAVYTAYTVVDPRKVINLIAQAMAVEFGFPKASIFLKSYSRNFSSNVDNNYEHFIIYLAAATTDALATAGILNSTFTLLTANQLSTAVVAKFSSLIATSLESGEWTVKPKWTNAYDQDLIDPLLGLGCKA